MPIPNATAAPRLVLNFVEDQAGRRAPAIVTAEETAQVRGLADLAGLAGLAGELRRSPRSADPVVWAAAEALECAAILLDTGDADRRREALALARSTVEAIKFALRDG